MQHKIIISLIAGFIVGVFSTSIFFHFQVSNEQRIEKKNADAFYDLKG